MATTRIPTTPFSDQRPGTSGLRKKVAVFQQPHYLENFVQSIFDSSTATPARRWSSAATAASSTIVAIQIVVRMAAANGFGRVLVGRGGILSTPAASCVVRKREAFGAIILSASHNPGGPDGDFGIKFNTANGGPAPEKLTEAIWRASERIERYQIARRADIDLGAHRRNDASATTIGRGVRSGRGLRRPAGAPVRLRRDRRLLRAAASACASMRCTPSPGRTRKRSSCAGSARRPASVVAATPLADFGGGHPDPNPIYASDLMAAMFAADAPDFGAASDGDGDRNMIVGRRFVVTPSDSLAVLAANAHLVPGYAKG